MKDGKELSGKLSLYKSGNGYFWVVKNVSFKVGDKIAGKGVWDVYNELISKKYNHVEIFDGSSLKGEWMNDFQIAQQEMAEISQNLGRNLNNAELATTKMFRLNKKWVQKLIEEDYSIIDLGDIPEKEGNYKGFSAFYAIEKKIIFGK